MNNAPAPPSLYLRGLAGLVHVAEGIYFKLAGDPRKRLLRRLPRHAACAELGVWKGGFSRMILEQCEPETLHLVDPWMLDPSHPDRMYGGSEAATQADMDAIHDDVCREFGNRANVVIHRGRSSDVLKSLPNASLDWIYIDGDHSYEAVLEDIELGMQKVKPGGLVVGDDYWWGRSENFPVRAAVRTVLQKHAVQKLTLSGSQFVLHMQP